VPESISRTRLIAAQTVVSGAPVTDLGILAIVHRSSFIVHRSSFIVHRSSFIVHRSSFIVHRSSFID
jgi:hypothetical protein